MLFYFMVIKTQRNALKTNARLAGGRRNCRAGPPGKSELSPVPAASPSFQLLLIRQDLGFSYHLMKPLTLGDVYNPVKNDDDR